MEAFHVTDSANRSGGVIAWSVTGLALQQIMGLLPQQWIGPASSRHHLASGLSSRLNSRLNAEDRIPATSHAIGPRRAVICAARAEDGRIGACLRAGQYHTILRMARL